MSDRRVVYLNVSESELGGLSISTAGRDDWRKSPRLRGRFEFPEVIYYVSCRYYPDYERVSHTDLEQMCYLWHSFPSKRIAVNLGDASINRER